MSLEMMKVDFANSEGIHVREIEGVDTLKQKLPNDWYAFANLEIVQSNNRNRQVDIAIVLDDRIMIADIKDWHGKISSEGNSWYQNGEYRGSSPTKKIAENARIIASLLQSHANKRQKDKTKKRKKVMVPFIDHCVILTGKCNIDGLHEQEKQKVFFVEDFCRVIQDKRKRYSQFADPNWIDKTEPLTAKNSKWRHTLSTFFNVSKGTFKPQEKVYDNHRVVSDATYAHPDSVYTEYDCVDTTVSEAFGLFRMWDFSKAPTKFSSSEYRSDIAGREHQVLAYLGDRSSEFERIGLRFKSSDPESGMNHWEIFERRKQLRRLGELSRSAADEMGLETRIDLVRVLLSHVAAIHRMGAAHLDIGDHSVWIEQPATVRLSHFMVAHYGENRSIAEDRYSFLGHNNVYPEDELEVSSDHFRRDVFLLGLTAHSIIFGLPAEIPQDGEPPEWNAAVDSEGDAERLHSWFERALAFSPSERFDDADVMLKEFVDALEGEHDLANLLDRLHRYQKWKSQLQLFRELPLIGDPIKDDDRVLIFRTEVDGVPRLVKMWKSTNWVDEKTDCTRLLEFCDRAELIRSAGLRGIANVLDIAYLMDGIVLVSEFKDAPTLSQALKEWNYSEKETSEFLVDLIDTVDEIHDMDVGHGDLSPDNILVEETKRPSPKLIDLLEFGSDRKNPAYSPAKSCGAMERDRFAVLKIAEELMANHGTPEAIAGALTDCRDETLPHSTLSPLKDALTDVIRTESVEDLDEINLMLIGQTQAEVLLPDEGLFRVYIRRRKGRPPSLRVAGAKEEVAFDLTNGLIPFRAKLFPIDQHDLIRIQNNSLHEFEARIRVTPSKDWRFDDAAWIFDLPEILAALQSSSEAEFEDATGDQTTSEDSDGIPEEDSVYEERSTSDGPGKAPAIEYTVIAEHLWKKLIEIESDIHTEAIAEGESYYSRQKGRHFIPYTMTTGVIDYNRSDIIKVEVLKERKNRWFELGTLDLHLTDREQLAIDASRNKYSFPNNLCSEGVKLRFESFMENDSRDRRSKATTTIVNRRARIPNLIDYFENAGECPISTHDIEPDEGQLADEYGLNGSQTKAFIHLWQKGPVGLLQGPPGTGKTKFIAAFVHFALTHGHVRNVLLASQAHEAVNNAAEEVLKLFRSLEVRPSLVRAGGTEAIFPDILKPFHTVQVENLYREKFRSRIRENINLAGKRLGLPSEFIEIFYQLTVKIRPLLKQLESMRTRMDSKDETAALPAYRIASLTESIEGIAESISVSCPELDVGSADDQFAELVREAAKAHRISSLENVRRMMMVLRIVDDWLGHVGSRRRNFEEFLVGTREIVSGTCVGLGRSALGLTETAFDLVVIDEASRCTSSELAVPLQAAKRVLLVGDQMQLEPFHDPVVVERAVSGLGVPKSEILRSDFERAFGTTYGGLVGQSLKTQYRMIPPIGQLVSDAFYPNIGLDHGRPEPHIGEGTLRDTLDKPITWIDSSVLGDAAGQTKKRGGTTLMNEVEANAITDLVKDLENCQAFRNWIADHENEFPDPIGIICTYRGQKELLKRKLAMAGVGGEFRELIKVDTVDSYQGKQNLIVILSLVRNNTDGPNKSIREGFMSRANRINVAISRAMDRLVIVGSLHRWPEDGPMAKVSEFARRMEADGCVEIRQLEDSEV
jgi:serine/threonine protein kinase